MLFAIHKNTVEGHKSQSGKAIYFTFCHDTRVTGHEWFPLSQVKISEEFNDVGWGSIDIPEWILRKKSLLTFGGVLNGYFEELDEWQSLQA